MAAWSWHWRAATASSSTSRGTRLGLPEVMLGIVPGWGGIKRLPPLTGAPAALDLLLTGRTVDARRANKLGIADECVPPRIMDQHRARRAVASSRRRGACRFRCR